MNLLPKASGNRPRLACEISADGVVAGRSPGPGLPLDAVARVELAEGAVAPGLKPSNIVDRTTVIAGLRHVLEQSGGRPNARNSDLTLVIPDAAVRVLLLDFDMLPNKLSEALPIVRFRLKKLVPFEADEAMVSFQVMSTSRTVVRVLAVAIPRDVLSEYESVAREAGFEPGAVLPSTLAAMAGVEEGEGASLIVNAHAGGITTAIVRAGIVLLHRSLELAGASFAPPANVSPALFERRNGAESSGGLPLVNREDTAGEWAAQDPMPEYGRYSPEEPAPITQSPYAGVTVSADLYPETHQSILIAPTSLGTLTDGSFEDDLQRLARLGGEDDPAPVLTLSPEMEAEEIASAVSVAIAYFEDSLGAVPEVLLSAGPMGAEGLGRMLRETGVASERGVRVRELVETAVLAPAATTSSVPRSWLAGVVGALKS